MKNSNLIYQNQFIGSYYFRTQNNNYLIGPRTGIHQELIGIKDLNQMEEKLPDTVFFSDLTIKGNVSCIDLEFVFLASLFLGMDFPNGKTTSRLFDFKTKEIIRKLRVVINKGDEELIWGQLEPSLLGASRNFLKNSCRLNKQLWEMLVDEAHFFNLKDLDGNQFKIEDFVEILYWDENESINIDGVYVKKEDQFGNFTVVCEESDDVLVPFVDFNQEDLKPYWEIPQSLKPFSFSDSSIIPLGTSSPFSIDAPPTSYWLKLGQRENYLIDCGFFTDLVFEKNGGNVENLKGIILTHCHGDHFNPIPFLYRTKPIELWTTVENYKLAQKITCAKARITPNEFQKRFIFKKIEAMYPGFEPPKYRFGFLDLEFHYSLHPIPTIGLTIYKEDKKLLVFSSDMVDLGFMQESLLGNNIISQERYDMFLERFDQNENEETLFLLDCGGDGFIHGKSGGYSKFFHDSSKIVECHRGARAENEKTLMQLAQPLNLFKISDYNPDVRVTTMISQMLHGFGIDYFIDLVPALKESCEVQEFASGQPIIVEGSPVKDKFYLIDYGNIISSSGLNFSAGEWFGEEALLEDEKYELSYFSDSAVRIIIIDSEKLKRCMQNSIEAYFEIIDKVRNKSKFRKALASARLFTDLNLEVKTIDDLSMSLSIEKYQADELIYQKGQTDDGHMYIILSGKVLIQPKKSLEIILGKNDIVGEAVASGKGNVRNANVYAKGRVDLIRIEQEVFEKLMENTKIYSRIKSINQNRAA